MASIYKSQKIRWLLKVIQEKMKNQKPWKKLNLAIIKMKSPVVNPTNAKKRVQRKN